MHDLAVLGEDGRETYHCTVGVGDAIYLTAHKLLCHAWTSQLHGSGVHLVADDGGTF